MGWRGVNIVVDIVSDKKVSEAPKALLHPDAMFEYAELAYWKVFLLGFAKHGSKDCWSPEKPLRGLPEYRSDWLNDIVEHHEKNGIASEEEMEKVFTYYTLDELEEIDLDEPVGLPDSPTSWEDYYRCLDLKMEVEEEWNKYTLANFRVETLEDALEAKGPIELDITEEKFGSREGSLVTKTGGKTKLRVEPWRKRHYGARFPELVNLLLEIYQNESFGLKNNGRRNVSKEDIRLIIGQRF